MKNLRQTDDGSEFYQVVRTNTPKYSEYQPVPYSEIQQKLATPGYNIKPTTEEGAYGYTYLDMPSDEFGTTFMNQTNPIYLDENLADFITTKPMSPANQLPVFTKQAGGLGMFGAKPEDLMRKAIDTVQHEYAHNITKFPQFKNIITDAVNTGIPSNLKLKGKPGDALSKYDLEELFTRAIDIERIHRKTGDMNDPIVDMDLQYIQSVLDKKYKKDKDNPYDYSSAISYINAIRPTVVNYFDKIEDIVKDQSKTTDDRPTAPIYQDAIMRGQTGVGRGSPTQMARTAAATRQKDLQQMRGPIGRNDPPPSKSQNVARTSSRVDSSGNVKAYGLKEGGRVGYALGSPEPLEISDREKRIAFNLYERLKDIEEQYTGERIVGDPSPLNLDPSDRQQGTLMASDNESEAYEDVIDAYNSGVGVEPGESLTDYIKRNNIKIKKIETGPTAGLIDELEPGPMKDELQEKFDPSQETYEEYLRRINLDRPFNAATGGRVLARDGLAVQTLNPLFPTKDPTDTESFKPLDLPGAIIPPLAIGAGAKRLKDIFFSKPEDESKEEIVERIEKIEKDKKDPNLIPPDMDPNDPEFINKQLERIVMKEAVKEAVDRLKQKEMDRTKRDDRTILARDLELDVPKSGLYELRKKENENFFQNRLQTLKDKDVNFDGYYSTREIANLLGIKTNSGIEDFIKRKNVPSVKQQGLYKVVKLNDFLNAYQPTKERIQAAPELDVATKARTNFLSEVGGSFYQKFKDLRKPKKLPTEVKSVYDKYDLTQIEGGHPFPVEFFTKKFGKDNTLQDKRQFDWIYRNKDKLFDKNNLVFQSKDVNTLYRDKISELKKQYKILSPLVDKYEGKGAVKNEKDLATIEAANNKIMDIIAESEFDAKKFIEDSPNSVDLPRMRLGGLHGALFNTDTGKVSLYTGAEEGAGFVSGAASDEPQDTKLKLAGDYLDIISNVIGDSQDKKIITDYVTKTLLPRFNKGGIVSLKL